VASATYNIVPKVALPVFSPAAGTYYSVQEVAITDATPGATIHYTSNGSTPTAASTVYSAPIQISANETIKAIAIHTGMTNSDIATATYTIIGSPAALANVATSISTSGAILNAIVDTFGATGSYLFRYGTISTALNAATPAKALGASAVPVPASAQITGLLTKTKYYYQVVVTTPGGTATGGVLSFTTN
jgi:hypothetical protein